MKRLAMIVATGIIACMISACGEQTSQKPEAQADDMHMQEQQPAAASVEPAVEAPTTPDSSVSSTESGDSTEKQSTVPSDEVMNDAAVQE